MKGEKMLKIIDKKKKEIVERFRYPYDTQVLNEYMEVYPEYTSKEWDEIIKEAHASAYPIGYTTKMLYIRIGDRDSIWKGGRGVKVSVKDIVDLCKKRGFNTYRRRCGDDLVGYLGIHKIGFTNKKICRVLGPKAYFDKLESELWREFGRCTEDKWGNICISR